MVFKNSFLLCVIKSEYEVTELNALVILGIDILANNIGIVFYTGIQTIHPMPAALTAPRHALVEKKKKKKNI